MNYTFVLKINLFYTIEPAHLPYVTNKNKLVNKKY